MKRLLYGAAAAVLCGLARAQSPAAQPASPIPFKQEAAGAGAALPGAALGVLLLSLLAIAAVYWIRKRLNLQPGGKRGPQLLRVLETQRLGPRTLLSVVEFAGGQYLVAQSERGVSCLASAPAAPAAPQEPA